MKIISYFKRWIIILLCLVILFTLSGCMAKEKSSNDAVSDHQKQEVKIIKFAHAGSTDDARNLAALMFKKIVEENTNGSIKVEVYPGSQLGGDRDAIEGVRLGTIQMTTAGAGIFATFEPKLGVTALPFLFENFEQAWKFVDSDINTEVNASLLKYNMRVLANFENGFRVITTSEKPINSSKDLKGLKIRTPENPVIIETLAELGANPSPLAWSEVFVALQQKTFDGQENPIPIIYNNKLYEVQKYLAITNHVYEPMPLVINEQFYESLSDEQKMIIKKAAIQAQDYNRNLIKQQTDDMMKKLEEKGMIITKPDLKSFKEATKNVKNKFADSIGEKLINDAYNFSKK